MDEINKNESESEISYFNPRICVIGLGNVGLPLAGLFCAKFATTGFDVDPVRVNELMGGHDSTSALSDPLLQAALQKGLTFTSDMEKIRHCNFYVVAISAAKALKGPPERQPLWKACEIVGQVISGGDIVVCESTLYPGVTEESCIPLIEKMSGLTCNSDFFAGCIPVQPHPGDMEHNMVQTRKVTSGSTPEIGRIVHEVYASVINGGTHLAPSIRDADYAHATLQKAKTGTG